HSVAAAGSGEEALTHLEGARGAEVGTIVLDLVMPGIDGLETLSRLHARGVEVPVVVQTAQGGIETVVKAMRAGAFDFVVKPVSPERLLGAVRAALKAGERGAGDRGGRRSGAAAVNFDELVTAGPSLDRVLRLARKAASSDIPILIEGESGVGKELVARAI